jgi:hypothetical protein
MRELDYDQQQPLNPVLTTLDERDGVVIADCRFDNAEGDQVVGYLMRPAEAGVTYQAEAGVVYQHWTGGREGFLPEAVQVAEAGGIAITLPMAPTGEMVPNIRLD